MAHLRGFREMVEYVTSCKGKLERIKNKIAFQCHFFHHGSHIKSPGTEPKDHGEILK
jgi:hypothetical protein